MRSAWRQRQLQKGGIWQMRCPASSWGNDQQLKRTALLLLGLGVSPVSACGTPRLEPFQQAPASRRRLQLLLQLLRGQAFGLSMTRIAVGQETVRRLLISPGSERRAIQATRFENETECRPRLPSRSSVCCELCVGAAFHRMRSPLLRVKCIPPGCQRAEA